MESTDNTTRVVLFGHGRELDHAYNLDAIGCSSLLATSDHMIADGRLMKVPHVPFFENRIIEGLADIFPPQLLAATLSDAAGSTDVEFRYSQSGTKIAARAA